MIKKILSLTALCFAFLLQDQANAQSLKAEAQFWIKGSDVKSAVNLNGNNPISDKIEGALMAPIGPNHSNFYIVFQSSDTQEVDLADVSFKCYQHKITTKNINPSGLDIPLTDKIQSGAIVKYGFNLGDYQITDEFLLLNNDKDKTYVYELIYINKEFTDIDHKHLQTYLSLKYGISLIHSDHYLSNKNQVLWDATLAPDFNKNITGLGKSNFYDLNQISTINSVDKLLTVSSNSLKDEEYVLIGNNGKNNRFESNGNEMVLDKKFLAQTSSTGEAVVSFELDRSLLIQFDASKPIYLNVNEEIKVKGEVTSSAIVFKDVVLNTNRNGSDLISISYDLNSIKAELADAWFLNHRGEVSIKPIIDAENTDYEVAWYFNDKLISNKESLLTNKTGVYEMRVTANQVTNNYQTTVYNRGIDQVSKEITVYPNPIKSGEEFKVSYNLGNESIVEVYIYQVNGKLVHQQSLGRFNQHDFHYKLESSGVYMIVSKIDGKVSMNKILVN